MRAVSPHRRRWIFKIRAWHVTAMVDGVRLHENLQLEDGVLFPALSLNFTVVANS